jgi:hypothetical protein
MSVKERASGGIFPSNLKKEHVKKIGKKRGPMRKEMPAWRV